MGGSTDITHQHQPLFCSKKKKKSEENFTIYSHSEHHLFPSDCSTPRFTLGLLVHGGTMGGGEAKCLCENLNKVAILL